MNRVIRRNPLPIYELIDLNGRIIDGKLYEAELQQIKLPQDTPIQIT